MNAEAIASYPVDCRGVSETRVAPLAEPAGVSITIYGTGRRDVGCEYLDVTDGTCRADAAPDVKATVKCIQLFPGTTFVPLESLAGIQTVPNLLSVTYRPEERSVMVDGEERLLTALENRLMGYLHGRPNQVVTREDLLANVWGGR